jgi:hypothetical protein
MCKPRWEPCHRERYGSGAAEGWRGQFPAPDALAGWDKRSLQVHGRSKRAVGLQEDPWILYPLGQTQKLFPQLLGHLQLCPVYVKIPQFP